MILKIGNSKFDYFNAFSLQLKFDSVASAFGFSVYFDSKNEDHKKLLKPLKYSRCYVEHDGKTLITGTILNNTFKDSSQKHLCNISGYSLPGVLEDCEIPVSLYPLQSDGLTLKEIAEKLVKPFGISIVIDNSVKDRMDLKYNVTNAKATQKIKSYLSELASQKNIILTHTANGSLLFTETKSDQKPIQHFERGMAGIEYTLQINGQALHSDITVLKEASADGGNAGEATVKNSLVNIFRPKVLIQSSGGDNDTEQAAKNARSEELKNIKLTITTNSITWANNGKIITPNKTISITDDELFLYKNTKWFVENVKIDKDNKSDNVVIECVLPEVYNGKSPVNIFA